MDTMAASQDTCQRLGGHLAAFSSREQQGEVEQAFIAAGQFVVSYQAQYWLGMVAAVPRNFRCGAAPLLQAAGMSGMLQPSGGPAHLGHLLTLSAPCRACCDTFELSSTISLPVRCHCHASTLHKAERSTSSCLV